MVNSEEQALYAKPYADDKKKVYDNHFKNCAPV